jgi:universal stress protein E
MSVTSSNFKRILAATDFSPSGHAAVRRAAWLASRCDCRLVVAHVISDLRQAVSQTSYRSQIEFLEGQEEHFQRELRLKADDKLKAAIRALPTSAVQTTYETLLGEPHVELIHSVQQERYDLLVVGGGEHTALGRLLVGSTAKRLVRKSPAPVWIVKGERADALSAILVGVDFSDASRRAFEAASRLAERAGAELNVLHVIDCPTIPGALLSSAPVKGDQRTLREILEDEANLNLDEFLKTLSTPAAPLHRLLRWGRSWREIVALAEQLAVDLVVVGSVGRTGLDGVLLGNTAESVLAHCECDVLAIKPAGFVSPIPPATYQLHPGPPQSPSNEPLAGGD